MVRRCCWTPGAGADQQMTQLNGCFIVVLKQECLVQNT